MAWQTTPYTVPLVVAAVVSIGLATHAVLYAHRQGRTPLLTWYGVLMTAAGIWTLAALGQTSATTLDAKLAWFKLVLVCSGVVVVGWLGLAFAYAGREKLLETRVLLVLGAEPLVFSFVVAPTDGVLHDLVLAPGTGLVEGAPFAALDPVWGSLFLFNALWSWTVVAAGLAVLAGTAIRSEGVYRGQGAALVVAGAAPLLANAAWVLGVGPNPGVDLTPLAFGVSGVVFWVAIFRYRLLEVSPVARDAVVEHMRDGYLVVDPDGRVADVNPTAERILGAIGDDPRPVGRPAGDLPGPVAALLADDEPSDVAGVAGVGSDSPEVRRSEEFTVETGGERRHVEASATPLSDGDERIGTLVILRDVTDRRTVERRYGSLIENSSDLITVLDEGGIVEYQSPSIEPVLGVPPEEVEGTNFFEWLHDDDADRLMAEFRRSVEDPDFSGRYEYRVRDADGEWRVLEGLVENHLDDPVIEGVVVNARDITDRKERERELRRQNERLEEFASLVSHDLRNPLNVATIHAENAYDDPDEHLPQIEEALDRMARMIDEILTLARQGETVAETEPLDLADLAREAWENVDTRGATLTVETTREVAADEDRLLRLFENLFRNSVEHSSTGDQPEDGDQPETRIEIRVGATDDGFYVEDDGDGIPPELHDRVFESGYSTRGEGTGLGLAIVRRIAEAHGWTVSAGEGAEGGARIEVDGLEEVLLEDPAD
ncbi:HTR-like protein [Halobacteriales archaeon QS_8_69_26]|nr:MAG: HTR-like protein [Halobacteriales archaeon QS_8_69_26]